MRWREARRSDNIEDRRGMSMRRGVRVGGAGGIGILILAVVAMLMGVDPRALFQEGPTVDSPYVSVPPTQGRGGAVSGSDELRDFVAVVLADTEDVWHGVFRGAGQTYAPPTLVLFSEAVESACGMAESATGPFYCPLDGKVYLDLSFFEELQTRFGAPGDFAQAYVIAHEVGHHVQNLLGITQKVHELRSRLSRAEANQVSVRVELQADCLAGVWANLAQRTRLVLDRADIEEGLRATSALGDDRIQRRAQGFVVPESFTHGSAAQRVHWFRQGLARGDPEACDTFRNDQP
ncbi:MAG TPA: neutral zinc metallopeptidase [Candidatus Tectomicrobia bacterium]|nr:neutral zinc metallopeptidase [Candidatus Tectomicrobia bacterium]